ncbi:MAG TPA: cytochrome c3 family protein [Flavitalea sp.]|nr:cytochrome c3 family protein [Flavitalea sp.]
MKKQSLYNRPFAIIFILILSIFFFSTCIDRNGKPSLDEATSSNTAIINFEDFAGSPTCAECHKDIYNSHVKTAHFLTSAEASDIFVKGNFDAPKNEYAFNRSVVVKMEKKNDQFYQVEYFKDTVRKKRRMDIVVGSGTMGQSSLSWQNNYLFQMPITYFSAAHQWSNSPGFPDRVVFNRVITSRCLECHSTFAKTISAPGKEPEEYDRNKIIYGVDCEKCHGPAAKHVKFQSEHPQDTTAKFIINPASFTRQQKLDLCALCHGGRLQKIKPSFSFTAGDKLSDYFLTDTFPPRPELIDVHGNQYGLLRASKCFQLSGMTCNTCHDVHKNQKSQPALFSQKCMSCHGDLNTIGGATHRRLGMQVKTNCIDCHMQVKPSKAIAVFLPGDNVLTSAQIRSHFIK